MNTQISPQLVEAAIAWAEQTVQGSTGRPLTKEEATMAAKVGVKHTELIQICIGPVPMPQEDPLRTAVLNLGLGNPEGLAIGYSLFLKRGPKGQNDILFLHECAHLVQFGESGGRLRPFIEEYLGQLLNDGYLHSKWEVEARRMGGITF